ncbi:hypothetical protein K438DRAFT_2025554 [Mycena galopus ATCC 62051]|nr:hypothetical protein K438DRAFT_2025554 [Mycena galopus ATCC 62051]
MCAIPWLISLGRQTNSSFGPPENSSTAQQLFSTRARAALTNLTIDDANLACFTWTEDPGIEPAPTIPWAAISPGDPCLYCSAQPPDIHDQTWHDGSNNSAGSFTFQGSAVYIYGIDLANPANISFTFDGGVAPYHYYSGTEQFVFNSLFFSTTGLTANVNHTVSWVLHTTKTNGSTGLFDYAVITVDQSQSSSSAAPSSSSTAAVTLPSSISTKSKSNTGAIAGGVVGGVLLIALLALGLLLYNRRRRRHGAPITGDKTQPATRAPRAPPALTDVQPFTEQVCSPAATTPGSVGEKTLDVSWLNPAPTLPATHSTASLPTDTAGASDSPAADTTATSTTAPTTTTTTARERVLEERLAQLEAQVQQHLYLPPPYVGSEVGAGRAATRYRKQRVYGPSYGYGTRP